MIAIMGESKPRASVYPIGFDSTEIDLVLKLFGT